MCLFAILMCRRRYLDYHYDCCCDSRRSRNDLDIWRCNRMYCDYRDHREADLG